MKRSVLKCILCLVLCAGCLAGALPPRALAESGWQYSETEGAFGRFVIEELGFAVPLTRPGPEDDAQEICDAWDSGVYDRPAWRFVPVVADHVNQGFAVIKHCVPGETAAAVVTPWGREEFLCVSVDGDCRNTGGALLDSSGSDIDTLYGPGWLVTYTCNENWENVTMVVWRKTAGVDPLAAESRPGSVRFVAPVRPRPY